MHANRPASGSGTRKGFALPAVMIALVVVTILGFGYLSIAYHEANLARKELDYSQAFFLAEAGLHRTYYRLINTDDWSTLPSTLYSDEPLGEGTYSVVLTDKSTNAVTVNATGRVGGMSRTVCATTRK